MNISFAKPVRAFDWIPKFYFFPSKSNRESASFIPRGTIIFIVKPKYDKLSISLNTVFIVGKLNAEGFFKL